MGWESEQGAPDEPKGKMKWVWALVAVIFAVTIFVSVPNKKVRKEISEAHAQHILITYDQQDPEAKQQALSEINNIRTWINEGQDFEKLAKQYSQDSKTKGKGGDLGWSQRGTFVEGIDTYIWSAPLGKVSDIIPTTYGFHIVRVLDRKLSDAEQYNVEVNERINQQNRPE